VIENRFQYFCLTLICCFRPTWYPLIGRHKRPNFCHDLIEVMALRGLKLGKGRGVVYQEEIDHRGDLQLLKPIVTMVTESKAQIQSSPCGQGALKGWGERGVEIEDHLDFMGPRDEKAKAPKLGGKLLASPQTMTKPTKARTIVNEQKMVTQWPTNASTTPKDSMVA
jgi:hypothetical protein